MSGSIAAGVLGIIAAGIFSQSFLSDPEPTPVTPSLVSVTPSVMSFTPSLVSFMPVTFQMSVFQQTQTVTVTKTVTTVTQRTVIVPPIPPPPPTLVPPIPLVPPAPQPLFISNFTREDLPIRQTSDPFTPFCETDLVPSRRAELKSLIGRNTGKPIPDRAVVLLELITYCQVSF